MDKENLGNVKEDEFYNSAGEEFEFCRDCNDPKLVEQLQNTFTEFGANISEDGGIVITENVKKEYFKERYEKVKRLVAEMDLSEFSTSDLYTLRRTIEETYDDYVYTEESHLRTFDRWLREAKEGKWYVGNIIMMH